jgi:hypothetical protein
MKFPNTINEMLATKQSFGIDCQFLFDSFERVAGFVLQARLRVSLQEPASP